jgi:hypothetical protein
MTPMDVIDQPIGIHVSEKGGILQAEGILLGDNSIYISEVTGCSCQESGRVVGHSD